MKGTLGQLARYALVGLASNAVGYGIYISLTYFGVGPKAAMSLLYVIGVLQTFIFNKRWTFKHTGRTAQAFWSYVVLYAAGYAFNLFVISLTVDVMGWPHQWVMLGLVIFMALFFFAGQKYWVFRSVGAAALTRREQS